nr:D-isomer specific 2-hydroxyacid dehydrogenase family protein [Rhodococcus sp. HNM0569]
MVAVGPVPDAQLEEAVLRGGASLSPLDSARALVWRGGPDGFPDPLPRHVEWVQLPSAGVERWFAAGLIPQDTHATWTSAAGVYAPQVAEHALTLLLAGVRALPTHFAATSWNSDPAVVDSVHTLRGSTVGIVGAGGIGRALIPLLAALGADVVAVNRSGSPVPGALETLPTSRIDELWPRVDHVVVAAPATTATHHIVNAHALDSLKPTSWVVNIARGPLVDTNALVDALAAGTIGGAGLDVTDPEPLPDDHPLWSLPNAIVTPHVANPPAMHSRAYADFVARNVAHFVHGDELSARIDPVAGY